MLLLRCGGGLGGSAARTGTAFNLRLDPLIGGVLPARAAPAVPLLLAAAVAAAVLSGWLATARASPFVAALALPEWEGGGDTPLGGGEGGEGDGVDGPAGGGAAGGGGIRKRRTKL